MLACLGGCMSATYRDTAGNELTLHKFCWETKIGHLEASNGSSRIVIENYDSESQAIELAKTAVQATAAMAAAGVRP